MGKISIGDIAENLGVSKTLVSFVINGRGDEKGIKKETQELVLKKVKELGYHPNSFARSLRTGKSKTIGVIVADISNPFYAKLCRSIEDELSKYSYNVVIASSDEKEDKEKKLVNMLVDRQVDGLIITPTSEKPSHLSELVKQEFPIVLLDRYYPRYKIPSVSLNNSKISQEVVEYLVANGHENIGLLSISPGYTSVMKDRINGYKQGIRNALGRVNNDFIIEIEYNKIKDQICNIVNDFVSKMEITALFALNNSIAKEVLKCAKQYKIDIPKDISLVSFDDIDIFNIVNPSVSAIKQPIEEMGKSASKEIINTINKDEYYNKDFKKEFEASFIIRDSVAKLS